MLPTSQCLALLEAAGVPMIYFPATSAQDDTIYLNPAACQHMVIFGEGFDCKIRLRGEGYGCIESDWVCTTQKDSIVSAFEACGMQKLEGSIFPYFFKIDDLEGVELNRDSCSLTFFYKNQKWPDGYAPAFLTFEAAEATYQQLLQSGVKPYSNPSTPPPSTPSPSPLPAFV